MAATASCRSPSKRAELFGHGQTSSFPIAAPRRKLLPMADARVKVLQRPTRDRFEEWLSIPTPVECPDPRFEVRRAHPSEFEVLYDLVDSAFGVKRPRPMYEWLYRRNPFGLARCWITLERASGRPIGSNARWPWPCARGGERREAVLVGDVVLVREWQRQGLSAPRSVVARSHPWRSSTIEVAWPNEKNRGALRKRGGEEEFAARIPYEILPLRGRGRGAAAMATTLVGAVLAGWQRGALREDFAGAIESVRRFDAACDAITAACAVEESLWFPHGADFLNWRYLEHPTHEYVALAAHGAAGLEGYCVVRVDGERGWLMEFVAPPRQPAARALLQRTVAAARHAGCTRLNALAGPSWPHWSLLRRAGFVRGRPWPLFVQAPNEPSAMSAESWQLSPGDVDGL